MLHNNKHALVDAATPSFKHRKQRVEREAAEFKTMSLPLAQARYNIAVVDEDKRQKKCDELRQQEADLEHEAGKIQARLQSVRTEWDHHRFPRDELHLAQEPLRLYYRHLNGKHYFGKNSGQPSGCPFNCNTCGLYHTCQKTGYEPISVWYNKGLAEDCLGCEAPFPID